MKSKKHILIFSIIAIVVFLDQLTKYFIKTAKPSFPIIKNIFHITYATNTGAGFGILKNGTWFIILISFILLALFIYYYKKLPKQKYVQTNIALIIGGVIGNLIDRLSYGYVIDFLDFRIWPIFNIADSAITIGAILLIIYYWKE